MNINNMKSTIESSTNKFNLLQEPKLKFLLFLSLLAGVACTDDFTNTRYTEVEKTCQERQKAYRSCLENSPFDENGQLVLNDCDDIFREVVSLCEDREIPFAGSEQAGDMAGDMAGSEQAGDMAGSEQGGEQAGDMAGSDQGGEQAGDMAGNDQGGEQAGDMAGSDQGGEQAGDMAGNDQGGEQAGDMAGSDQGGVDAGVEAGDMAGSDQGGVDAGVEAGDMAGGEQGGEQAGLEQFNDLSLTDLNNSYPNCFSNFHHAQLTFESIFRRFFEGLNDGSIQFVERCNHDYSLLATITGIDFDFNMVDVTANGCYEFTGFALVTPRLYQIPNLRNPYFIKDTRSSNVFLVTNREVRWGVVGVSQRGTDSNNTTCDFESE